MTMRELERFVKMVARLRKDGEPDAAGDPWDMPNDDAVDTLHRLIDDARDIIAPARKERDA